VQFGATVELLDEDGNKRKFTIVGVDEVDTAKGRISWQSPIGKTLIGKAVDEEVLVKTPSGDLTYEVVSIVYKPIE